MTHPIAKGIARQIGNPAFVMLGAYNLVSDEKSLTFKIKGLSKIQLHSR